MQSILTVAVFGEDTDHGSKEADLEALNCLPALNLIRSTKLHLST